MLYTELIPSRVYTDLNNSAADLFAEPGVVAELGDQLLQIFDVAPAESQNEALEFLHRLYRHGVLQIVDG